VSADLPSPQQLIDEAFDFTEKLLASQREFTHQLVAASTPQPPKQ